MSRPPDYGIIYNWDGAPLSFSEVPQSVETFLEKAYAPIEDTRVGALFWSVEDANNFGKPEPAGLPYETAGNYIGAENLNQMRERGEDHHTALIQRGHELGLHVYASIRMNDNHYDGAQIEDLDKLGPAYRFELRRQHSEWLLGDQTTEWFALSWNMATPEIRELRYGHVEEMCRSYEWDGVELDWQRHAFHFPDDHGYRLKYLLTDLMRATRNMTNALADERGRPFYVAARVSATLEGCRHVGYDIPAWVEEGLVDILIPSGGSGTDPDADVRGFLDLCRGTDIAVYPGLYGGLIRQAIGPEDEYTRNLMISRGIASRYRRDEADGVYVFNFHGGREKRRELLTEMGSAEALRRKDKTYAATYRNIRREGDWRNAEKYDRMQGEVPVALKRTLTGDGPTITIDLADDLSVDVPESIELRLRLEEWVKGDLVRVFWDGGELENFQASYSQADSTHGWDVSNSAWLTTEMRPDQAAKGKHRVKVILAERNPRLAADLVLTDVELVVRF